MTGVAEWLMVFSVAGPLLGAVVGIVLIIGDWPCVKTRVWVAGAGPTGSPGSGITGVSRIAPIPATPSTLSLETKPASVNRSHWHRVSAVAASLGIGCSFLSAIGAASVLGRAGAASCRHGTWLELTGTRHLQIEWGLRIDQSSAIWVAVLSGLAWMTVAFSLCCAKKGSDPVLVQDHDQYPAALSVTTALVLAATVGFILSSGLVPMLICWTALSLTTFVLVGWSSPSNAAVQGMRRAVQAGLPGDVLLFWAVLWIGQVGGLNSFDDLSSAEKLTRLGAGNPAFPGMIGCLLILGVLGRCGLFPCFGWHQEATAWDSRACIVIYGIGYVPSALWMLLKCHPLLTTSEAPLSLLGGLGTLGAVLGAFVACGQDQPFRRLAYLLASQAGVMLAALGSGLAEAVPASVMHQCSLSIAAFVLFASRRESIADGPYRRAAIWCAALSVAGLMPLSGGWSQQGLIEMNAHPVVFMADETESGEAATMALVPTQSAPHWGRICGLWLVKGLSAYATVGVLRPGSRRGTAPTPPDDFPEWTVILAAALLWIGGPCGWLLGFISFPTSSDALARLGVGQFVAVAGLIAGWWAQRATNLRAWESINRLSQQRLYVDQICGLVRRPLMLVQHVAARSLSATAIERAGVSTIVRLAAWLGLQVESLLVGRTDFYLATILLGTATLLLTLILVA